jgi:hypothetical protein
MEILPPAQRLVWPDLAAAHRLGFVLYGGTAIALRLGHRSSVDFDFFTADPLKKKSKALVYFEGGDLENLDWETRKQLIEAAQLVRRLPPVDLLSESLTM